MPSRSRSDETPSEEVNSASHQLENGTVQSSLDDTRLSPGTSGRAGLLTCNYGCVYRYVETSEGWDLEFLPGYEPSLPAADSLRSAWRRAQNSGGSEPTGGGRITSAEPFEESPESLDRHLQELARVTERFFAGKAREMSAEIFAYPVDWKRLTEQEIAEQYETDLPADSLTCPESASGTPENVIAQDDVADQTMSADAGVRAVVDQLVALDQLADGHADNPIETLEEVHAALRTVRNEVGRKLEAVFNQWTGTRWPDYETSRQIASLMDEAATVLGLSFRYVDAKQQERAGSLRCNRTGRDRVPSFVFITCDSSGKQVARKASRELMRSELGIAERDQRRTPRE